MSTQSTPGQSFPTPCKRCGGALYPPDDTCPWCGASHAVAYGVRLKTQGHALPPDSPTAHAPDPAHPAVRMPPMMLPDTPIPPLSMPVPLWKSVGKWIFSKGLVLICFLIALAYAGYTLFGDHKTDNTADEPAAKSATGSIVPYEAASAASTQAPQVVASVAPTPTPTPAPAMPAPTAVPVPSPAPPPSLTKSPALPSTSTAPAPSTSPVVLPPLPPHVPARQRTVPESLQAARAGLQANDLAGAQTALSEVLVAQPDNAEARLMQQDLLQRTTKRDNALRAANVCATDRLWSCVRHNATDALAIDSTNPNVRALLERAIREAGWNSPALPTARGGAQATAPAATASANVPPRVAPPVANRPVNRATNQPANQATNQATSGPPKPAPPPASINANDTSSVDARERAIRESGWSHPAASSAATASASTVAH
jgi:hypothetical protein